MREIQTKYVKLEKQERYTFLYLKACVVTNLSMKVVQRRGNNSQKQQRFGNLLFQLESCKKQA